MTQAGIDALHRGFRDEYLDHDTLTEQLRAWAEAYPELVRLESLVTTEEGREVWLLTVGPDPDRTRPAAWIDGNLHASELCGSSACLQIAEDLLRLHLEPEAALHDLSDPVKASLKDVLFYIVPRISPDGAEAVLKTGRFVRSIPRDDRPNQQHPHWRSQDLDGDGRAMIMRKVDPTGEFVQSDEVEGLMLPREIDDAGPFYKIYPEGLIANFDGENVPDPYFLSDNDTDLNRNFPYSWAAEPDQAGAGAFPGSAPETRAVIEFATKHPNLFFWLNYHTFGGVFIRPLGNGPDSKMNPRDLALFRQIGAWADELIGYETVNGYEEFLYEPGKALHGDESDFAYHVRGCVTYVVELWDLFKQFGMKRPKKFVDYYTNLTREDLIRLGKWDGENNRVGAIKPWRSFEHPQLGAVEIGGVDPVIGMWNPPLEQLAKTCLQHSAHTLRVASLSPRVVIDTPRIEPLSDELSRVQLRVENHGYLPTYVLDSAKALTWNEPLYADVRCDGGCELVDAADAHQEVGHLDGWGRGLFGEEVALYFMRSRGSTGSKPLSLVVKGKGTVTVTVGSCRTGSVSRTIEL